MDDNLTKDQRKWILKQTGRQRMPKSFDRNELRNLIHLHK